MTSLLRAFGDNMTCTGVAPAGEDEDGEAEVEDEGKDGDMMSTCVLDLAASSLCRPVHVSNARQVFLPEA